MRRNEKNENVLFKSIQLLRMRAELDYVEKKIEEKAPHKLEEESNFFKKTIKGAENLIYRDAKSKGLGAKKEKIEALIAEFTAKNPEIAEKNYTGEEIKEKLNGLFKDETSFSIARELLAVSVIMDNAYPYVERDVGLEAASEVMYGDENELPDMERRLLSLYSKIAKKPISAEQRDIILGAGVGAAALAFFSALPAALQLGALGASLVFSCLIGGIVFESGVIGAEVFNYKKARASFRKMNFEESARLLTVRCFLLERCKMEMEDKEIKEQLSDLLSLTDDWRSDVCYELFVEKENIENNKAKLRLFHNFDNEMINILSC